jgi:hypothetical protein
MGPPTADTCKLLKYLVQTCPTGLEVKTSQGDTPLMTACWFGRVDFVKILIDAGADQSVRNKAGVNILHAALKGKPKAKQLRPFLDILDADLLSHLFITRSNLHETGTTPLHAWVTDVSVPKPAYSYGTQPARYKKTSDALEALALLLEYSKGAELEMLNGAGDTCLHSAIMQDCAFLVEALLKYRPKLLYRENAVGRTPAEVALDRLTAEKFKQPNTITLPNAAKSVTTLLSKPAKSFVEAKPKARVPTAKEKVWQICAKFLAEHPDKRRLVSLNEANDVAKRLGENSIYQRNSRYFRIQARDDDDAEDDDEKEDKRETDKDDFATLMKNKKWPEQWKLREWQYPVCEGCGKRHEPEAGDDAEENEEDEVEDEDEEETVDSDES